jgi:hypothetical protein
MPTPAATANRWPCTTPRSIRRREHRDAERPCEQVARPAGQHADRRLAPRERSGNLHRRTVAAEREHDVELVGARRRDLGGVPGALRVRHLDRRASLLHRFDGATDQPRAAARGRIGDEKDAGRQKDQERKSERPHC